MNLFAPSPRRTCQNCQTRKHYQAQLWMNFAFFISASRLDETSKSSTIALTARHSHHMSLYVKNPGAQHNIPVSQHQVVETNCPTIYTRCDLLVSHEMWHTLDYFQETIQQQNDAKYPSYIGSLS